MATKYLQHFPKPLLDDLVSGRWLPVIGAGLSLNAKLPAGKKMPLWPDLGKALGSDLTDFAANGTLDAISAYEHEFGRVKLIERLREVLFINEAVPGDAHKAFCSIGFDIVCTTNFDFLLERQYELTPRYVYPVIEEEQLSVSGPPAGTLLLKLHGDLHHPSRLVVSEQDYDGFLAKYPLIATFLSNQLITKTAVFVGYSLDDPDFRQIWAIVANRLGRARRMAYCLMVGARPSEITRFERRGVKVISLPGSVDRYGEILTSAFQELREYMRDNLIAASHVTEEPSLRELSLPRNTSTRLCFFSLPLDLVSLYRSRVFPVVQDLGFVPVTADDVVSPGDNINAKIDALIDRASVMIVELSTRWTRAEFDIALARKKAASVVDRQPLQIIVVVADPTTFPDFSTYFQVIHRGSLLDEGADEFVADLASILRVIAAELGNQREFEAQRLFEAKEYRAAVIAAMTAFEAWLRDRQISAVSYFQSPNTRPVPLRRLLDGAIQQQTLNKREADQLAKWITIRNEAVHTETPISRNTAKEVVEGIASIISRPRDAPHEND